MPPGDGAQPHAPVADSAGSDGWHDQCLICRSRRLRTLPRYERAHLVRCVDCGMTFARRVPTDDELARHYQNYGHAWYDSPITRQRYRELLDGFESRRQTNRLFDCGCGAGYFLEEARSRGWEVYGSEYSSYALELTRAKGLEVVEAPIAYETYPPDYFDVVTAFEVFEHLRAPLGEATIVAHILRPGGLLYCTTPNFNSLSRRLLGSRWSLIEYPEHLSYFTPATLRSWLERVGFEPTIVTTSGISLSRLRRGPSQASDSATTSADDTEGLRGAIEHSRSLRLAKGGANAALAALAAGDTIKAHFTLRQRA